MDKLGWEINNLSEKIEIKRKTLETDITLEFSNQETTVLIKGTGDLTHHLIEDAMLVLNKLAELKGVSHKII